MRMRTHIALLITAVVLASSAVTPAAAATAAERTATTRASQSATSPLDFPAGLTRLQGANRYETAIATAQRYPSGVDAVFVATGQNFPDALSAAAAAAHLDAPLLLTAAGQLDPKVRTELRRLAPREIFLVGGTGVVSKKVEAALREIARVSRLAGASRYETGRAIVDRVFTSSNVAYLATGRSFPDALSASGAAGSIDAPVLLVDGASTRIDTASLATIERLGVSRVVLAGGDGAISPRIADQLRGKGLAVERQGGATRYETSAAINSAVFGGSTPPATFLATGDNFPDALAGGALAGAIGAPILITRAECAPIPVRDAVLAAAAPSRVVLGGSAVVSDAAARVVGCPTPAVPKISGSAVATSTLTAHAGAWNSGTAFVYQWLANGAAIGGATGSAFTIPVALVGKRISVRVTGSQSGFLTQSITSGQTAAVSYPGRVTQPASYTCPAWAPIKGNADSGIYHMPGQRMYDRTAAEDCFRTEADAIKAGYRKSKI